MRNADGEVWGQVGHVAVRAARMNELAELEFGEKSRTGLKVSRGRHFRVPPSAPSSPKPAAM
jgi:hypothetical protein